MNNRHDKFKAYWKELGKPKLEVADVGKNNWCDCTSDPSFYNDADYRIANDRHFELRRKWIDSDKTLPVEWRFGDQYGYDQNDWKIGVPEWRQDCEYREAQVAEEINHPEYGVIRSYHDEQKNNGGDTDYYAIPEGAVTLNDLIEHKSMNFAVGNIFKAAYRLGEKDTATEIYDLNKIIYYANRQLNILNKRDQ